MQRENITEKNAETRENKLNKVIIFSYMIEKKSEKKEKYVKLILYAFNIIRIKKMDNCII